MTTSRPLWRWWLFCATLSLWWRFQWDWLGHLYAWAVLPEWLGDEDAAHHICGADCPF